MSIRHTAHRGNPNFAPRFQKGRGNPRHKPSGPVTPECHEDITAFARDAEALLTPELGAELLDHLGLPHFVAPALSRLGVGWWPHRMKIRGHRPKADKWTFREYDGTGTGRVIGLAFRHRSTRKLALQGYSRGIGHLPNWKTLARRNKVVFLVEGFSDLLTLIAAGHAAISRPGNKAGITHLAGALADLPPWVRVVVVGERDYKTKFVKDGKPLREWWPGRYGAYVTATKLAALLGRQVEWGLVPHGVKDTREWFLKAARGSQRETTWAKLGAKFADLVLADVIPADPFAPRESAPLEEPRCSRPPRVRVCGNRNTPAAGDRAAIEPRCRSWPCGPCKQWQQNRWRTRLYRCVLRFCDPLHYPEDDSEPAPPGPATKDGQTVGPWNLYASVVTDAERKSILAAMADRNNRHLMKTFSFASARLPDPESEAGVWSLVLETLPEKKTIDQSSASLLVMAVHPMVKPHRGLTRITPAVGCLLADAGVLDVFVADPADRAEGEDTRQRPVTASEDWRPPADDFHTGNWRREGRFAPSASHVRELAKACDIENPDRAVANVQDSTVWTAEELASWVFGELIEPAVCDRRPDPADFARRHAAWVAALAGLKLGPDVVKVFKERAKTTPGPDDRRDLEAAEESDRVMQPCREEMASYESVTADDWPESWRDEHRRDTDAHEQKRQDRLRKFDNFRCPGCDRKEFVPHPHLPGAWTKNPNHQLLPRRCMRCGGRGMERRPQPYTNYAPYEPYEATAARKIMETIGHRRT